MWTKLEFLGVDGRSQAAAKIRQELSGMRLARGERGGSAPDAAAQLPHFFHQVGGQGGQLRVGLEGAF